MALLARLDSIICIATALSSLLIVSKLKVCFLRQSMCRYSARFQATWSAAGLCQVHCLSASYATSAIHNLPCVVFGGIPVRNSPHATSRPVKEAARGLSPTTRDHVDRSSFPAIPHQCTSGTSKAHTLPRERRLRGPIGRQFHHPSALTPSSGKPSLQDKSLRTTDSNAASSYSIPFM